MKIIEEKIFNKKGVTLIELLIVLVVIAIIDTISIQSYISYRTEGTKKSLLSDTKNCFIACIAKISDNINSICSQADCSISSFTDSCIIDISSPTYVTCHGKNIIQGYSCSVYQSGQTSYS